MSQVKGMGKDPGSPGRTQGKCGGTGRERPYQTVPQRSWKSTWPQAPSPTPRLPLVGSRGCPRDTGPRALPWGVPAQLTCAVLVQGTLAPGQRLLEGVEEVPHDPGDDGVVVEAHHEGHEHGCDACSGEAEGSAGVLARAQANLGSPGPVLSPLPPPCPAQEQKRERPHIPTPLRAG